MVSDSSGRRFEQPRSIPKSTMVDIHTSSYHRGQLSAADMAAIASIGDELNRLGIVRPVETMHGISSEQELSDVLHEAEELSLAEEELNPEYHSARLDETLMGLEGTSNPLMEKFDDYEGLDYNPAFRARDKLDGFRQGSSTTKKRRTL